MPTVVHAKVLDSVSGIPTIKSLSFTGGLGHSVHDAHINVSASALDSRITALEGAGSPDLVATEPR